MSACDEGGMLVGARENLPVDSRMRYVRGGDVVGCNRIVCGACGSSVRHLAGAKIDVASFTREQHERFYEELGATTRRAWKFLTTMLGGELFRVYACRCNWDQTPTIRWLSSSQCDGWRCAGHPG